MTRARSSTPRSRRCCDGGADLLQRDAGVEQPLDDLEHEDVAEAVEPLGAGAGGAAHRGLDQPGAGPVVELAVGDAGGVARGRAAVADVLGQRRDVVVEEQTLLVRVHALQRCLLRLRIVPAVVLAPPSPLFVPTVTSEVLR